MSLTSVHPTQKTMNANVAVVLKEFLLIVYHISFHCFLSFCYNKFRNEVLFLQGVIITPT